MLHARGSSYAKEAAAVHRIPLIDVSHAVGLGSVAVVRGQKWDGRERDREGEFVFVCETEEESVYVSTRS